MPIRSISSTSSLRTRALFSPLGRRVLGPLPPSRRTDAASGLTGTPAAGIPKADSLHPLTPSLFPAGGVRARGGQESPVARWWDPHLVDRLQTSLTRVRE